MFFCVNSLPEDDYYYYLKHVGEVIIDVNQQMCIWLEVSSDLVSHIMSRRLLYLVATYRFQIPTQMSALKSVVSCLLRRVKCAVLFFLSSPLPCVTSCPSRIPFSALGRVLSFCARQSQPSGNSFLTATSLPFLFTLQWYCIATDTFSCWETSC